MGACPSRQADLDRVRWDDLGSSHYHGVEGVGIHCDCECALLTPQSESIYGFFMDAVHTDGKPLCC